MTSPCPCRGCTAAYNAGLEDGKRLGYRDGYNDHARGQAIGNAIWGFPTNQHCEGENP